MAARKVIIDCDPGIDDAVALAIALFEPSLEVLAVTATEGNASAEQTTRNVQTVVECLDPPRYPRFGKASPPEFSPPTDIRKFHGGDGLGNLNADVSVLHHERASDKLICDVVRSAPEEVTIICLGPLTNVARAIQRDPETASMIGQLIIMGGTIDGVGNATACAEYNIYYDPAAADAVFQSPTTKTIIPLDVTRQTVFSLDLFDELPPEETTGGAFLHHILQHTFRAHRSHLGLEGIQLHDAIAVVAAIQPKLFTTEQMHGQVETGGSITSGMTIFDRRPANRERANMAVATGINVAGVKQCIVSGLTRLS
jgi:purine nucleosidase